MALFLVAYLLREQVSYRHSRKGCGSGVHTECIIPGCSRMRDHYPHARYVRIPSEQAELNQPSQSLACSTRCGNYGPGYLRCSCRVDVSVKTDENRKRSRCTDTIIWVSYRGSDSLLPLPTMLDFAEHFAVKRQARSTISDKCIPCTFSSYKSAQLIPQIRNARGHYWLRII